MRESSHVDMIRHGRYDLQLACDSSVSEPIRQSIRTGSYEWPGGTRLLEAVRDGDKVLELGGGLGCLATLVCAARSVQTYDLFEADMRLLPLIRQTFECNNISAAKTHNIVLTDEVDVLNKGHVDFYLHPDFWASSTCRKEGMERVVQVPARSFSEWISVHRPDVIHCDVEGAELGLFANSDLAGVRVVTVEVHYDVNGTDAAHRICAEMKARNFACDPDGMVGGVFLFVKQ